MTYFRGKFSIYSAEFNVTGELVTEPNCNLRIYFLQTDIKNPTEQESLVLMDRWSVLIIIIFLRNFYF